jgi:hypothetical protein
MGHATAQEVSSRLTTAAAQVRAQVRHVGFMVDKVTLGQVFSEYFCFPRQFSFHWLLHTHHLSSGAGTIGQLMPEVPSWLSLTPPQEKRSRSYHVALGMFRLTRSVRQQGEALYLCHGRDYTGPSKWSVTSCPSAVSVGNSTSAISFHAASRSSFLKSLLSSHMFLLRTRLDCKYGIRETPVSLLKSSEWSRISKASSTKGVMPVPRCHLT